MERPDSDVSKVRIIQEGESMRVLDLCSGYGGASEAFLQAGDDVQRYEIDRSVSMITKNTTHADIRRPVWNWLPENGINGLDLVWCSPPCRSFSNAYSAPRSIARRAGKEYHPDLTMVLRCKEIIDMIEPKFWVIENVLGSRDVLEPILGKPTQVIGAYVLWGNFPTISLSHRAIKAFPKKNRLAGGNDRHSVQKRALIPISLSWALREAMLEQTVIEDFV